MSPMLKFLDCIGESEGTPEDACGKLSSSCRSEAHVELPCRVAYETDSALLSLSLREQADSCTVWRKHSRGPIHV